MIKYAYMLQRSKNYLFYPCPCADHTSAKGEVHLPFCLFENQGNFVMVCSFKTQTSQAGFVVSSFHQAWKGFADYK